VEKIDIFELGLNDYLGLSNHPVRKADTEAAAQIWCYCNGTRMMSGHTNIMSN
jgi:7-keto-8-aminopelargonate synthetase-like enzyme